MASIIPLERRAGERQRPRAATTGRASRSGIERGSDDPPACERLPFARSTHCGLFGPRASAARQVVFRKVPVERASAGMRRAHMGGCTPSLPAITRRRRGCHRRPSWPRINTAAPGRRRPGSPGARGDDRCLHRDVDLLLAILVFELQQAAFGALRDFGDGRVASWCCRGSDPSGR